FSSGLRAIAGTALCISFVAYAQAQQPDGHPAARGGSMLAAYVNAFTQLTRHEIAALALTLGILCFAVVTAILLWRTRRRLSCTAHAAHHAGIALRAEVDRVHALLLSEPHILVSWAAADDVPEIVGDSSLVVDGEAPDGVLTFGSWLDPDQAQAMRDAV